MDIWKEEDISKNRAIGHFLNGLNILWGLSVKKRRHISILLLIIIFCQFLHMAVPYQMKMIFDRLPLVQKNGNVGISLMAIMGSMLFLLILIVWLENRVQHPFKVRILAQLENILATMCHNKLLSLSLNYHERENTGKKISKIDKGIQKSLRILIVIFWMFLPRSLFIVINLSVLLFIDWKLGLIMLAPLLPSIWVYKKNIDRCEPIWNEGEKEKERSVGFFCQSIINVATVQNFVQETLEHSRYKRVRDKMEELDIRSGDIYFKTSFGARLLMNMGFFSAFFFGIWFYLKGETTLGTLVYVFSVGMGMKDSIGWLTEMYMDLCRDLVGVKRMKAILDAEPDIKNSPNAIMPEDPQLRLEMKNVSFFYKDKEAPILDNISINIAPSSMTALVGISGAGKTTLIRLLSRLYEASKGEVLFGGINIKDIDLYWYRKLFAIVQQNVELFDGTIRENIAYAHWDATEDEVVRAAKAARLEVILDDKDKFPKGMDTVVGERGIKLSGGEAQRVGIARAYIALLYGAKILILDEATSDLDSESDKFIQERLLDLQKRLGFSILAIAHRLSTIYRADMIYVLQEGKIIERGNHVRLLEQGGKYKELVDLQQMSAA